MPLITLFSAPKPFTNPHIAMIQSNAIKSWTLLPEVEVILLGEETGLAEAAKELGVKHFPNVARNESGTPLISSMFQLARENSNSDLLCIINADMILMSDFVEAAIAADDMASVRSELREMRQMVTLTLMQQQSASDRIKGVNWSSTLERPGNEVVSALLDTLLHDPNVNVRLAAIDALARFAGEQQVRQGAIDALRSANSPMVQIALIDFVVGVRDTGSIDTLKKLVADPSLNETVRRRASQGLDRLGAKS